MTDIPEELVERVEHIIREAILAGQTTNLLCSHVGTSAQAAIRAVLDWQAKEWVEIPRLDRP